VRIGARNPTNIHDSRNRFAANHHDSATCQVGSPKEPPTANTLVLPVALAVGTLHLDSTYTSTARDHTPGDRLDSQAVEVYVLSICRRSDPGRPSLN
jgi:hypothetical protein